MKRQLEQPNWAGIRRRLREHRLYLWDDFNDHTENVSVGRILFCRILAFILLLEPKRDDKIPF